ncbi:hypothetical protein [Ferrimonas sediminum]|uniref:hypothetical protein n=1 Tax=Ferrimonas sediminum TaxID=718193 RepID=UPI000B87C554|nr:hypothetical protein [Ferrimonas sediminum]
MSHSVIQKGLVAAGIINIGGVLLFSKGFSNDALTQADPVLFSTFGLLSIILWGAAYLAVSGSYRQVPWIMAVFAVEKLLYTLAWSHWMVNFSHDLPALYQQDWLAGAFFSIYGLNDALFMLLFFYAFIKTRHSDVRPSQIT